MLNDIKTTTGIASTIQALLEGRTLSPEESAIWHDVKVIREDDAMTVEFGDGARVSIEVHRLWAAFRR